MMPSRKRAVRMVVAILAGAVPVGLCASRAAAEITEGSALAHIYQLLSLADHDYDGHRVKAMHEVEAAGQRLGVDVRGDHRSHEVQRASDDMLRQADSELQQVQADAAAHHRGDVVQHVNEAIHQIHVALHIK